MFLEIITPDDRLFEGEVEAATFPGMDGTFQVLNDHAPMVSSLGLGELKYQYKDEKHHVINKEFNINGGVVEILNNRVLVLIESLQSS